MQNHVSPKFTILFIGLISLAILSQCRSPTFHYESIPIDHEKFTLLLQKHIDAEGWVDYTGFKQDEGLLNIYLDELSTHPPLGNWWSYEDKLAYWINAYNAFTIKLILNHYPVASIKDIKKGIPFINSVWDIKFFEIGKSKMDLNTIEHSILRKQFDEPRIHFAINCASISCPRLRNSAYTATQIDQQLTEATNLFLHDPSRNQITADAIKISKIFRWFKGDFTKSTDLITFLNQYSSVKINDGATIDFLDYDWKLNEIQQLR